MNVESKDSGSNNLPLLNLDTQNVDIIVQLLRLRDEGFSYFLVANDFNERKVPVPENIGVDKWSPELVKKLDKETKLMPKEFLAQLEREASKVPTGSETSATFEILPNGKKRYLKATIGDYVFSVILPFWGVVIGGIAILRGEKERGQTMMLVGGAGLILYALLRLA